ncbi:M56 family metallopeptidase [Spelaeicoccus albus]|nr:M56 family metallopeptidase [Spelaeicoccus albus]
MAQTSIMLAVLAVLLAWPVPVLLARARWAGRDPLTALVLWQSIGLSGGLAMIGAGLVYAVSGISTRFPDGLGRLADMIWHGRLLTDLGPLRLIALAIALILALRLLSVLILSVVQTVRHRRRHRQLLDILSRPSVDHPEARLLDHTAPVAYCLPGPRNTMVLSAGIIDLLSKPELEAVIAHERAHLEWRHDLVILPFVSWHRALPWLRAATVAHQSISTLVEMLADDTAIRTVRPEVLASAIALVGRSEPPAGGFALASTATELRIQRLTSPPRRLAAWNRAVVVLGALALLAVPTVSLIVPFFP